MKAHKLSVPRTAHYYTIGEISKNTKRVWIACHGYGQSAERFITKFDVLDDGQTLVVAPEGLSRFYWGGFTGDVVSSWMTSGDRLDEIADFSNYLQSLYGAIVPQLADNVQINLFGFSQGVATILRWAFQEKPFCHNLILWAGSIPDELDYKPYHEYLVDKNIEFVYGLKDQFLTPKRLVKLRELAKRKGISWQETTFDDKHIVVRETLKVVAEKLVTI